MSEKTVKQRLREGTLLGTIAFGGGSNQVVPTYEGNNLDLEAIYSEFCPEVAKVFSKKITEDKWEKGDYHENVSNREITIVEIGTSTEFVDDRTENIELSGYDCIEWEFYPRLALVTRNVRNTRVVQIYLLSKEKPVTHVIDYSEVHEYECSLEELGGTFTS